METLYRQNIQMVNKNNLLNWFKLLGAEIMIWMNRKKPDICSEVTINIVAKEIVVALVLT